MKNFASCIVLVVFPAVASAQTFTVGATGADFTQIQAAIDSPLVPAGATVVVQGGTYSPITLTKSLNILAKDGEQFDIGHSIIGPVSDFALVGARGDRLIVRSVPGRSLIDGGVFDEGPSTFRDCGELLIQRVNFRGVSACYPDGPFVVATGGAEVERSTIVFTDCDFTGGQEVGFSFPDDCEHHYPGAGLPLRVADQSEVVLASCGLRAYHTAVLFPSPPVVMVLDSRVTVRGNQANVLRAATSEVIQMDATSTLKVSGVELFHNALPIGQAGLPAAASFPAIPEPFLEISGGGGPGAVLQTAHFAPLGSSIFSAVAFGSSSISYPLGSEAMWLDPAQIWQLLPLAGQGQEVSEDFQATLPTTPTLAGLRVTIQSAIFSGPNAWLTNPVMLVLGA